MLKHQTLETLSRQLGITRTGVSRAGHIPDRHLEEWLRRGYHGSMGYMERNREKRLQPEELLPGVRSVISVFVNYYPETAREDLDGVISRYARAADYHPVLKDLLHQLAQELLIRQLED